MILDDHYAGVEVCSCVDKPLPCWSCDIYSRFWDGTGFFTKRWALAHVGDRPTSWGAATALARIKLSE